ncbi:hypothetical protein FRC01_001743 [Tulasnella sp. 417]|nr:hypothetical protein FRC01_001743 [Tulasnella sp. 417]
MLSKVMVAVGMKKKTCEYCNAAPVHEGFDYCSKTCGTLAKARASAPPASGPPRNGVRSARGRGRADGSYHEPPSPRMCHTCGTRPVYKNRDYCSRSCSEGVPWNPPASAPARPPRRNTDNRDRNLGPPRADYSRNRRYSDYDARAPDSRRARRDYSPSDEEDLPDTPPSNARQQERQQGRHQERPQGRREERGQERQYGRHQGRNGRENETAEPEENYDDPDDAYSPPPYRGTPRSRPEPPPKSSPGRVQTRQPSGLTSGSPWPPKTPQPRPRPREMGPYDEPYQSD